MLGDLRAMQLLSQRRSNSHTTRTIHKTPANVFLMISPITSNVPTSLSDGWHGNSLPICRVPDTKNSPPKPGGCGRSSETLSTGGTSMAKRSWELGELRSSGRMIWGAYGIFNCPKIDHLSSRRMRRCSGLAHDAGGLLVPNCLRQVCQAAVFC